MTAGNVPHGCRLRFCVFFCGLVSLLESQLSLSTHNLRQAIDSCLPLHLFVKMGNSSLPLGVAVGVKQQQMGPVVEKAKL